MARRQAIAELRAQGGDRVKREFTDVGRAGDRAFDRIRNSARGANPALRAVDRTVNGLRSNLVPAGVAATAAAVGLALLTQRTIDFADEIGKAASARGISTDFLQEVRFAADLAGTDIAKLDQGIVVLGQRVGEMRQGTGSLFTFLNQLSPEFRRMVEDAGSTEEAFNLVIQRMADTEDAADRLALANAAFGRSGRTLVNVVRDGAAAFNEARQQARDYGAVLSADVIARSEAAKDQVTILQTILRTGFQEGFLSAVLAEFDDFEGAVDGSRDAAEQFGQVAGDAVVLLAQGARTLAENMDEAKIVISALIGLKVGARFGAWGGAIGGAAGALGGWITTLDDARERQLRFTEVLERAREITDLLRVAEAERTGQLVRLADAQRIAVVREIERITGELDAVNDRIERVQNQPGVVASAKTNLIARLSEDVIALNGLLSESNIQLRQLDRASAVGGIIAGQTRQIADAEVEADVARVRASNQSAEAKEIEIALLRAEATARQSNIALSGQERARIAENAAQLFELAEAARSAAGGIQQEANALTAFIDQLSEQRRLQGLGSTERAQEQAVAQARDIAMRNELELTPELEQQIRDLVQARQALTAATAGNTDAVGEFIAGLRREQQLLQRHGADRLVLRNILTAEAAARRDNVELSAAARLEIEALTRAVFALSEAETKATESSGEFATSTDKVKDAMKLAGKEGASSLSRFFDELREGSKSASESFGDLADSILDDLARIAQQKLILQPFGQALDFGIDALFSRFGSGGSDLNQFGTLPGETVGSARGNVVAGGNVVPFRRGGLPDIGSQPAFFQMAGGGVGSLRENNRPEGIFPLIRTDTGDLGVQGVAPVVPVTIQVINQSSGADVSVEQRRRSDGGVDVRALVADAVVDDLKRGGPVAQTLRSGFGVQPGLASR